MEDFMKYAAEMGCCHNIYQLKVKKVKLSLEQALKVHRGVRGRGSYIF
jgi:hypothetical protein